MFVRNQNDNNLFKDDRKETEEAKEATAKPQQTPAMGGTVPQAQPQRTSSPIPQRQEPTRSSLSIGSTDNKILTVGRDITLSGEIKKCDRLIIEGEVDASLQGTRLIEISAGGIFRGDTEVEEADIAGEYTGSLTVKKKLLVRKTGRVIGSVNYKELVVEAGGQISGDIQCSDESADYS